MESLPSTAEKLARLAELENDLQRALEVEKLEAMAEFAAGAGHEINNPLTVIFGRAQLLLRDESDPERRHALALIGAQAMRIHEMIADMMLFARPPQPELKRIDLLGLVDEVIAGLLARSQQQETEIRRVESSGPIYIEADSVQLQVALRAVCQNALEALQDGGHIEISLECVDESPHCKEVHIQVRDDGPGLKPEERRHLFDPFYSARQAGRGLGFGLSKAWCIMSNHGGRIEVDSQAGEGAVFTLILPMNPADSSCSSKTT